jgi:hypothetical protein
VETIATMATPKLMPPITQMRLAIGSILAALVSGSAALHELSAMCPGQ